MKDKALVSVVMGSDSDWKQMKPCCQLLDQLGIPYDKAVVSAHRMPDEMMQHAKMAQQKGYQVIIAGAGGSAHLPGMLASQTLLPVIGVPIKTSTLNGMDSLLSIVQMPAGVPVATMAIGVAGSKNAALTAARIVGLQEKAILENLTAYMEEQHQKALKGSDRLE